MLIQSHCFACEKTVHPVNLSEDAFWSAIDDDGDVEVMHVSENVTTAGDLIGMKKKIYAMPGPKD